MPKMIKIGEVRVLNHFDLSWTEPPVLVDPWVDQLKKIAPFYDFLGPSRVSESNELVFMLVL